ncbi:MULTISPECIES: fructose-1,6-bisphosphatase [Megamonas]|uniref:Fructose-1,6-bisphosphatase class 3 n=1 Tax=Megamonas rupellensis TaxID=491921 RepID=A0A411ZWA9_9FIRM|nr:fructose-1,6-bisphosphatase [Megamonas rupellensis]MBM6726654.1 fructose-1,6-bisphosphatase [Megamonas funiformis]MBM6748308.1 fructose-1,6-bisphosphatase [Megamonas rupellensis]MCX4130609.1 fructose-1,6-bisphosphatase [Megamonas funiformis]RGQ07100.1 fructose-1,6-bisphosphatase [Megamonas rupellensis]
MDKNKQKYKYLYLLSEKYPNRQSVVTELIRLKAILNLARPTEHFMSDLHGEYESFFHILNNCSGVIKEKVDYLFSEEMSTSQKAEFCTLIYYPKEKILNLKKQKLITTQWYSQNLIYLLRLSRLMSYKYPQSELKNLLPKGYETIILELLTARPNDDTFQEVYFNTILNTLININSGTDFIIAFTKFIKKLAVAHLHIVGDIYDRGQRPDSIIDMLRQHHSVDIQWGNHDILWMGAMCGNEACIATVVRNCLSYNNTAVLEKGYAISLRSLSSLASKLYPNKTLLIAMQRTISIILFKLEGQLIKRNPDFQMDSRLLLDKIDYTSKHIKINNISYPIKSPSFPTINPQNPYELSLEEAEVLSDIKSAFLDSVRLRKHIDFLYQKGSVYKAYNNNLLYHGCIPLNDDGSFMRIHLNNKYYSGKNYLDFVDKTIRQAYLGLYEQKNIDLMYYFWCGRYSPFSGREFKTFERMFIENTDTWIEPSDAYYKYCNDEKICDMILEEFSLKTKRGHIINGHVPVKVKEGESPVKANGKLIIIDGGFCKAYHKKTGIAGYTLISNSRGLRLLEHQSCANIKESLKANQDIESVSCTLELQNYHSSTADTDLGEEIQCQINDIYHLMLAYQNGLVPEQA